MKNLSRVSVKAVLESALKTILVAIVLGVMPLASSMANNNNGTYTGPQQLSLNQVNPTGACACGTTVGGNAAATAISFAPILSTVIKEVITLPNGEEEIIYEEMVAVVEMERVGNDYYTSFHEVRAEDAASFIAGRNQGDNIYYVMGAEEFLDNNGSSPDPADNILPSGVNIQELQVFELPPEEDYEFIYFEGPGGAVMDYDSFIAMQ